MRTRMDATVRYQHLVDEPPSAKLVYKVLELEAPLTHGEITEAAVLPSRTTSYALSRLQDAGVIESVPCPSDPRKKNYRPLPIQDPTADPESDECTGQSARERPQNPQNPQDPKPALPPGQPSD